MSIQDYIEKFKLIQNNFLSFVDNETKIEENYQNLFNIINSLKICENRHDLKYFLSLLVKISNYHYRCPDYFSKIEKIILNIKDSIRHHFSNDEIFGIFKYNKRITLFLIEEKIIVMNDFIYSVFTSVLFKKKKYHDYFYPEVKPFINNDDNKENNIENFEVKRKNAENDDPICEFIRNDSIEDFIIYVKKNDFPLTYIIKSSPFETNSLLIKNDVSMIEYSAFFGAIQIFKYLHLNIGKSSLTPSLWLYSIHGQDPEIIQILEENQIKPEDITFDICLKESIKMFNNDMAKYFLNNYNDQNTVQKFDLNITRYCFLYYNFTLLPVNFYDDKFIFYYCCDFYNLVEFYLKTAKINLNAKAILRIIFNKVFKLFKIHVLITKLFLSYSFIFCRKK